MELPHKIYLEAAKKIAELHNLSDKSKFEMEISEGSAKGDNYAGALYRIQIKCKENNSIKLSFVLKVPPQNAARRDEFQASLIFDRETQFYNFLLPMYRKFQAKRGVSESDGFYEAPKIHLALTEEPNEGIFLEDLKARNFEMFDRKNDLSKEHVKLVMKALAKMHAVFFCIKDQEPENVKSFIGLEDFFLYFTRNKKFLILAWYEGQKKLAFAALEKIENLEVKRKISHFLNRNTNEMMEELLGINVAEPYSTICHGDPWCNNMMFRNDENGKPTEVSLLDFQILRFASPVVDIMYHIFSSTTKEMRNEHYQEFLDTYYDTLADLIRRLNSDPEKVYSRQVFNDQLMKFGKYAIFGGTLVIPVVTSNSEGTPDIDEISEKWSQSTNGELQTVDFKPNERCEQRMIGMFEDICRFGYL